MNLVCRENCLAVVSSFYKFASRRRKLENGQLFTSFHGSLFVVFYGRLIGVVHRPAGPLVCSCLPVFYWFDTGRPPTRRGTAAQFSAAVSQQFLLQFFQAARRPRKHVKTQKMNKYHLGKLAKYARQFSRTIMYMLYNIL